MFIQVLDAALLLGLAIGLISGRLSTARVFAIFAIAVIISGRISFDDALVRLTSPAILAVTSLVIISAALSKIPGLSQLVFGRGGGTGRRALARFLGAAAGASAVVPNTAVVGALMGPATRHPRIRPHTLLLPLSYVSLAGGMLTPFGTSASLMVVGEAAARGIRLDVLDFTRPGLVVVVVVFTALVIISPIILRPRDSDTEPEAELFYLEARIDDGSDLSGRTVSTNRLRHLQSFYLAEIVRGDRVITPVRPDQMLHAGDRLIFVGDISHIEELRAIKGLQIDQAPRSDAPGEIYHAVIASQSVLPGKTLREVDFRARFDASVMAVQRGDESLSGKLGDIRLRVGDVLILAAGPDFRTRENIKPNLHLLDVDDTGPAPLRARDSWLMGGCFAIFLGLALTQSLPFHWIATGLAVLVVGMHWLTPRETRRIFPFDLIIILWGAILLSMLVQQSGLSQAAADLIEHSTAGLPPVAALAAIFLFAWAMTELFSNASSALTALPVALDTAFVLSLPPEPFVLAAAFGASASFLMPFGYQTHLMVLTPGRYSLPDFLKLGSCVFLAYATATLVTLSTLYL